jgi:segregation and condensation protein A
MDADRTLYKVKTPIFEGPLSLLLDLIERRKLFVNEIALAQVTDDYVSYIKTLQNEQEGQTTETKLLSDITSFIIIAATIILIKSKSLLPNMLLTEEEENEIGTLEDRLKLYKVAKDAGEYVKKVFGKATMYAPLERKNDEVVFTPDERITASFMRELAGDVLRAIPKKEVLPEIEVKKVISIEEMIGNLGKRIEEGFATSFREFSGHKGTHTKEEKVFVIVSFLAMLELVRQGILDVLQNGHFDEIEMKKREDAGDINMEEIEQAYES